MTFCPNCDIRLIKCKSKYGFYLLCGKCKSTFETASQKKYNDKNYGDIRF